MTRIITAYQRLTLDDDIDATELCAEAVLRGDGMIVQLNTDVDANSLFTMLGAADYLKPNYGTYEFKAYKHDFFKCANASEFRWIREGSVIKFMCAIKDYFHKSGADVVYIHFR